MADIATTITRLENRLNELVNLRNKFNEEIQPIRDTIRRIKAQVATAERLASNPALETLLNEGTNALIELSQPVVPPVQKQAPQTVVKESKPALNPISRRVRTQLVPQDLACGGVNGEKRGPTRVRMISVTPEANQILRYAFDPARADVPATFRTAVEETFPNFATRKTSVTRGREGIGGKLLRDVLNSPDVIQIHTKITNAVARLEAIRTGTMSLATATTNLQQLYAFLDYENRYQLIREVLGKWGITPIAVAS